MPKTPIKVIVDTSEIDAYLKLLNAAGGDCPITRSLNRESTGLIDMAHERLFEGERWIGYSFKFSPSKALLRICEDLVSVKRTVSYRVRRSRKKAVRR